ncbi:hypothetical protein AcidC75_29960 [Acidisoma sp. C75]
MVALRPLIRSSALAAVALAWAAQAAWAAPAPVGAPGEPGFVGPGFVGPGWAPMMMDWDGYSSGGWFMMLFGGVIVVALLVFLFRALSWSSPAHHGLPPVLRGSAGLHTLDERYARGEISREEYLQKKRDIQA